MLGKEYRIEDITVAWINLYIMNLSQYWKTYVITYHVHLMIFNDT